jgi:hypothetical protein
VVSRIFHIFKDVPYLWNMPYNTAMKGKAVRTTVDIPAPLYRQLKAQAAARGCSAREVILGGIRQALLSGTRPAPKPVRFPLLVSEGPKVDLTNEQIYEYVEFP